MEMMFVFVAFVMGGFAAAVLIIIMYWIVWKVEDYDKDKDGNPDHWKH